MKRILSLIALSLISFVGFSQTKGISYQAVIIDPNPIEIPGKDVTAQPYVSKDVWIRFGIYAGTTLQYEELHKTKTDEYGLVNLIIGGGVNTGKAGTFTSLSWDGITKNIITNVSFDQGGRYTEVSNQKFTYVPYTLLAETAVKLAGVLPIASGGTGATNAIAARTNLGLGNVDNTADVDKQVSIPTLAILDTKESLSNKSTNIIADSASSVKYPSVKAIKDYIDSRNSISAQQANQANRANLAAKATALETPRTINGIPFDGTANITIPVGVTPPDADATTKGLVKLAGDLSGTADAPAIATGAVTTGKLAAGSVTDAKITSVAGSKVTGNIAGNAGTSTKLAAPKNINGVPFDGSTDITIAASAATLSGTVAIANGGTGATTAADARTNLGLVIGTDVLAQRTFGTAANSAATDFVAVTEKGANNGVATLGVNGKIPSVQIPSISFQSVSVVNSDATMTAISGAQVGSIAIRSDQNINYVLSALPATTLSNWIQLAASTDVSTINGLVGPSVNLTTNEIPEGATNKYYTDARVRGAISATGPLSYNASTGNFSMTAASGSANGYLSSADFTTFNNKQTALTAGVDYVTPAGNITGNAANVTGIVSIANGGTGTSTASGALLTLGAEPSANKSNDILVDGNSTTKFPTFKAIKDYVDQQSANAGVADNSITSAKINGSLAVLKGGTGATTAAGARTNLGLVIGTDVMAANFTTTLTGDVTGSGNGSFATTVNSVGGVSSATISTLPTSVSANTASITANTSAIAANTTSITANTSAILLKAPIASPTFTGTPSAPTPAISDNSTTLATTEYVKSNLATVSAGTLTGTTLASTIMGSSLTSVGTITSGVWSGTEIAIAKGGTGATTAAGARTNLGLGSLATKSTIANADVASGAAIDFTKLNITKADITGLGIQEGLTAGSGISIASGTISATGLTTANLSSSAGITNAQLANSSTTLGSTTMSLGGTVTSVTGLTSLAATNLTGTLSGTATSLATGRTIALTGDVTYTSPAFDGSGNVTAAATLANSGVASGTYGSSTAIPVLTVDTKGRVTSASTVGIIAGVNSLNYTSTTSYAAGGTISGTALTLSAADGTNPGLISTGVQTIAGAKTFSNDVTAPNFIGNVTGTVTGNLSGTANTATNLAGGVSGSIPFQTAAGVTGMIPTGQANQILTSTGSGTYTWTSVTNVTGNSVPYTGATGAVNLGAYDLTVNGLTVGSGVNGSTLSNTAFGVSALASNNSGLGKNTALGYFALNKNTSGQGNTAVGYNTSLNQTSSLGNTAIGSSALEKNIANGNTAVGNGAGYGLDNNTFQYNSFLGYGAGGKARGAYNVGIGNLALEMRNSGTNTGADRNVAIGNNAMTLSSKPIANVVIGDYAGYNISNGSYNVILGQQSGYDMTAGYHNTILGDSTGLGITTGSRNTIIGAKVTGLSPTLTGNIILADGAGNIRAQHDGTGWSLGTISSGVWSGTAIANNKLANSSTILGSTTMTLGGTVTSVTGLTSLAATNLTGTLSGTATSLATGRTIALTGDVTYTSPAFDGSGNVTAAATLAASGVASGTYGSSTAIPVLTLDTKGRVTSASTVGIIAGVNSLNYTSTTSYAAGGTISGTSLTLAAADGTNPGLISTGAQTIAGAKTFNSDLVVNGMTVGKGGGNVSNNTALGFNALTANVASGTPGINNTAVGYNSLSANTTGGNNVAIGNSAGSVNVGGSNNVFIGNNANAAAGLVNNANAIAIGSNAIVDAPNKIQLGDQNITAVNTSGTITAAGFTGPLSGNATTATTAGNITATSNTTLTSLVNLATVGTITSGTWSATEVAIAKGGTGATTAADARTNLGLGSLATKSTIANADVASGAAIDFVKLNITKANITGLGIQDGLTAGSGISISSGVISATGLTTANLSSTAGITNAQLANSSTILGSTTMTLGGTVTSVTGLTSLAATNLTGTLSGTATSLATGRTIALTGDVTYTSPAFDGSGNVTAAATLAASGVASGTYGSSTAIPVLTVDTKGRITTASTVSIVAGVNTMTAIAASSNANGATISGTALTLTPADASNGGVVTIGAQTFAGTKTFANTITATSALAKGTIFSPTLNAAANNDVLVGVDISPTYSIGAYTGVSKFALRSSDDIKVNGLTIGLGNGNTPFNTVLGVTALSSNAGGTQNVAVGLSALASNTTGSYNTAIGYKSMLANTTGNYNAALGFSSLYLNTTASDNTSIGNWTMFNNTTGARNTVVGSSAMYTNSTGKWNTAVGYNALYFNVSADQNTAVGYEALKNNTVANNTAVGYSVLSGNSTGTANTGMGNLALGSNTSGSNNSAFGATSLRYVTTGSDNVAFGQSAGLNATGSQNVYIGSNAGYSTTAVSNNIFLGFKAGQYYGTLSNTSNTTGDGNIMIGTDVRPLNSGETNQIVIAGYSGSGVGMTGNGSNTVTIGNTSNTANYLRGVTNLAAGTMTSTSGVNLTGSIDDFFQYNVQNTSTGTKAQSGYAATANNGTDLTGFAWMGINNSNFNYPTAYNIGVANDVTYIGSGQDMHIANANNTKSIIFSTGISTTPFFSEKMRITATGNVGIGTASPTATLHVAGTARIVDGNQAAGKLLISDASGNASWSYAKGTTTTTTSTTYAITLADAYVFYTGTAAAAFTIPAAAVGNAGKEVLIKNKTAFGITITPASGTIFIDSANTGAASVAIGIEASNNWIKLVSDGTQWNVIRALF